MNSFRPHRLPSAVSSPPNWVVAYRRAKAAIEGATRDYCERLVQRALMIDPEQDDRLTVDVHFCDVR